MSLRNKDSVGPCHGAGGCTHLGVLPPGALPCPHCEYRRKIPWASDTREGKRNHFEISLLNKAYPQEQLLDQSLNCLGEGE